MLRGWKMYSVTPSITTNIATYFRMLIVMQNSGIPEIENSQTFFGTLTMKIKKNVYKAKVLYKTV